jgi:acylphosphatase
LTAGTHESDTRAVRVRISGRVQGVGFRAWTEGRARSLGLSGWVRNRRDGDVEAVFSGSREAVAAMLDACRSGPPHAQVAEVDASDEPAAVGKSFLVLPDG